MIALIAPLTHALLGPTGPQRVRSSQALPVMSLYLGFALVLQVEVRLGLTSERQGLPLTVFGLVGCLGFYALIRSGANLRMSEPSLTPPQMLYSMIAMGFLMLAAVIAWRAWTLGDPAETRLDLVYRLYAGIVFTGVAIISVRLGHIRERLREQAAELKLALARNREMATRDVLTGLTNRRAMLEQMAIAAREIERHGQPLALVLFDLDHFKQIDDTRGQAAGDRVLQRLGEVAQAEIRAGDVLARWGGEEFLLMLPRTGLEQAWRCAERIRTRLVALKLEGGVPGQPLTFSAGVSSCRRMDRLDAAIEAADRAMYLAKATGRNRTELVAGPGLAELRRDTAA